MEDGERETERECESVRERERENERETEREVVRERRREKYYLKIKSICHQLVCLCVYAIAAQIFVVYALNPCVSHTSLVYSLVV